MAFRVWLCFLRFLCVVTFISTPFFLLLNNIVYAFCLWLFELFPLFGYSNCYKHLCIKFCMDMFSVFLGTCLGVELLAHKFTLEELPNFFKVATPFYHFHQNE